MLRSLLTLTALMVSMTAYAGPDELDNESKITNEQAQLAASLPATTVTRTNLATGEVEVLHLDEKLSADASSQALVADHAGDFKAVPQNASASNELDRDSSSSSWYFFWYNYSYSYPSYYYSGYNYHYYPYYNYYWGNYAYQYYRWYW